MGRFSILYAADSCLYNVAHSDSRCKIQAVESGSALCNHSKERNDIFDIFPDQHVVGEMEYPKETQLQINIMGFPDSGKSSEIQMIHSI